MSNRKYYKIQNFLAVCIVICNLLIDVIEAIAQFKGHSVSAFTYWCNSFVLLILGVNLIGEYSNRIKEAEDE